MPEIQRREKSDEIAKALRDALISPNVSDSNGECANVVDAVDEMSRGVWRFARAVEGLGMRDASELGAAAYLCNALESAADKVANSIHDLADAVREHNG